MEIGHFEFTDRTGEYAFRRKAMFIARDHNSAALRQEGHVYIALRT